MDTKQFISTPLCEQHAHLAASINPSIYWQIAHDSGFKLPQKDYHKFTEYIMLSQEKKTTMKEYFDTVYHPLLDKLSSGTHALEKAVYEIVSGAYRANNITVLELRNNPMKHNNNAQLDLDHIIMAMLRGMEKALLEYQAVSAGILFCLDRQFSFEQNEIIVEKAIKYHKRGVVGIDFANYDTGSFHFKDYQKLIERAKKAGLKVTAHSGETVDTNDMWEAIEFIEPARIGHGIKAAYDQKLMKELVKKEIVLEVCPMSNIITNAVSGWDEMEWIIKTLIENKVLFTINTDWPELIEGAHLRKQVLLLLEKKILSYEQFEVCNKTAFASTFVPKGGLSAYL